MVKRIAVLLLVFVCGGSIYGSGKFFKTTLVAQDSQQVLQTDDTIVKLGFSDDGILLKQLSDGDNGWNWAGEGTSIALLQQCLLNGVNQPLKWKWISVDEKSDDQTKTVTAIFSDESAQLELHSIWEAHGGAGPIEHTIMVINEGKSPVGIGYCPSMEMLLKLPDLELRHQWVEKGSGAPSDKGTYVTKIEKGFNYIGISRPNSKPQTNDPIPWQCIDTGNYGIYTGIESTGCIMQRAVLECEKSLRITLGIDTNDGEFNAVLGPKEIYVFPTVFVGCYKGDIDDGCNRLHRWAERWLCPQSNDANLPLIVNNSWGSGIAVDEKLAKKMIDDCEKLGLEMYHIDAGWYKTVGWWYEDPNKFPNGLKVVSDYAHCKGLKFGLWVGWTQGGDKRALAGGDNALSVFNPQMKDWFPKDMPTGWKSYANGFTGEPVCLACEDAKNWCLKDLSRIVKDYRLDLLEHDQTMLLWECSRKTHGHTDAPGDISHRCCENYYKIHDALMKKFPNLMIENCVHGGRQVDFGAIKHSHYTCATDSYSPMSLRRAFYDTSFPMPPRVIEGYLASNLGKTIDNFRYCIRSSMLGWCTIMMDTSKWTNEQKDAAKKQFEIYKKVIRPQIRDGNLYHVSDRPNPNGWDAFEYYTPATGKGIVLAFRAECEQSELIIKLKGLNLKEQYSVNFEDGYGKAGTFTGKELMEQGITINLPSYNSSDIIYLSRINAK